jgi:hypothetical protein
MPVRSYSPAEPEETVRPWFVSGQTAEILAPDTAPPLASVTVPLMSPVIRCADTDAAQRRKISVQLIDIEMRLDIGPPRHEERSLAGTTRLVEILCRCRFLSTRFEKWVKPRILAALAQIHINVTRGYGFQRVTRFATANNESMRKSNVASVAPAARRPTKRTSKFSTHLCFEGGAPGGVRTPDP